MRFGNDQILNMENFDEMGRRIEWLKSEFSHSLALEPTAVGAVSSAIAVHVADTAWLSFFRHIHAMTHCHIILLCVLCFTAGGCAELMPKTTASSEARPYTKPVLSALASYHRAHGEYPATLQQLQPEYISPTFLFSKEEGGISSWRLSYHRIDQQTYQLLYVGGGG